MKEKSMVVTGMPFQAEERIGWRVHLERLLQEHRLSFLLFTGMGFLLGRAQILGDMYPFALAYYAVVYQLRQRERPWVLLAILMGAASRGMTPLLLLLPQLLLYTLLVMRKKSNNLYWHPLVMGLTLFLTRFVEAYLLDRFTYYQLTLAIVEGLLCIVLYYLFRQALPLLHRKAAYPFTHEELVSCVLLLASIMIGVVGLRIGELSLLHVLSRWAILIFAFIGNGMVGATAGVVVALIISLADVEALPEIGRLAFAGLLAGLVREAGKLAVSFGFLVGSSLLTFYLHGEIGIALFETTLAILLFILTPKKWLSHWASYVPGTLEYKEIRDEQTQFVRQAFIERVEQLSQVFQHLSRSYLQKRTENGSRQQQRRYERLLELVTNETCLHCWLRDECWENHFDRTDQMMKQMAHHVEQLRDMEQNSLPSGWLQACRKVDRVLRVMKKAHGQVVREWQAQEQMERIRQLVAQQFSGISQVMSQFAHTVEREGAIFKRQEEVIRQSLENLGISFLNVQLFSLQEGNVDVQITQSVCDGKEASRKLVAPLLSQLTGENIVVKEEGCQHGAGMLCETRFISANQFQVQTGYAGVAKAGRMISGDVFSEMNVGEGKMAIAISDGMGNGERAHQMSQDALNLLHDLLRTGLEEQAAIQMANAILGLRSEEEMFATVDISYIDLQTGDARFLKIGAPPSYIIRGEQVMEVTAENLPLGIVNNDIAVEVVEKGLKAGDLLLMITDGIYDLPNWDEEYEEWIQSMLARAGRDDPQRIADTLLDYVIEQHPQLADDMTILVIRVEQFLPTWSTIPFPRQFQLERIRKIS